LILPFILEQMHCLLKFYLSGTDVELNAYRSRLFQVLRDLLKNTPNDNMKNLIALHLIKVVPTQNVMELQQWLLKNQILGDNNQPLFQLTKEARYEVIKQIFRSKEYTRSAKQDKLINEMKKDFSDIDVINQIACEACLPEMEKKMQLWQDFKEGKKFN